MTTKETSPYDKSSQVLGTRSLMESVALDLRLTFMGL